MVSRRSEASAIDRLNAFAEARGLRVRTSSGTQREPENVVSLQGSGEGAHPMPTLLSRSSMDSIETAAMYVLNTLERLGVEVDG